MKKIACLVMGLCLLAGTAFADVSLILTFSDADAIRVKNAFVNQYTQNEGETIKAFAERVIKTEFIRKVVLQYERSVADATVVNSFVLDSK